MPTIATFDVRYDNELAHVYYGEGSKLSDKLREIYQDKHLEIPNEFDSTLTSPPIHFMTYCLVSARRGSGRCPRPLLPFFPRLSPFFLFPTLSMSTTPSSSPDLRPVAKRRKIRKGTFSCWECKHRKRRCELEAAGAACAYCQARDIHCVGQDHPDPRSSRNEDERVQTRILHVEKLVGQLIQQRDRRRPSSLVSLLPHPSTAMRILTKGRFFSLPFQSLQCLSTTSADQSDASTLPLSTAHPIQFAQKLIQLALGLQQLGLTPSPQPELQLNKPTESTARRYLDLATCHVTSHDALVGSLDGLDTLLLQARYHINSGDLGTAWLTFRRALSIAQLIGLPWGDPKTSSRAESIWVQLVYNDRFLSLMLGLGFAVKDHAFPSDRGLDAYSPLRKLYRIHGVIAGHIISRNVRMQRRGRLSQGDTYDDYGAARSVPVDCWETPTLDSTLSDTDKMDRVSMLITQMHQHYLLILLHQPYIIPRYPQITHDAALSCLVLDHTYSKQVVVPASREVLSRCLAFRNIRPILSYRGLEHKAFTAAVTLLLSHIMGHRLGSANILEHQRPQDLATIQKVIRTLDELCSTDDPNRESAIETRRQLSMLLTIEADAANGVNYTAYIEDGVDTGTMCITPSPSLRLPVPYFGAICIMPDPAADLQVDSLGPEFSWVAQSAPGHFDCLPADNILSGTFCDGLGVPTPDSGSFNALLTGLDVELQSPHPEAAHSQSSEI
ncbi:uncharacterized protein BO80DRAFT_453784 [Aspergillus ibericus CBS 121593]|uniref:Zn(2)-C6 fungal-type domain-containing protein n=1 Tax=Aspergillus ibericus CBS 121593 TaxID=1448316 RepID=A0A395H5W6_9EURO|nr:hypothetical protein BO80DRAFT_453784 [Aspergillus ibericus CBS 121593]RAL02545.1 hypothetical protein BO80DRAFT_453784 [Aspergillus ibericus CBS 121593]